MTPVAHKPDTWRWMEYRSDKLIQFFESVIADLDAGRTDEARRSLKEAVDKIRKEQKQG